MDVAIRPMRITDYDRVAALWKETEGVGLSTSDSRSAIERFLERNPDLSLVAESPTGEIIGAVLCSHDGVRGYLRHLAVSREHRRQGLGRRLADRCLRALKSLGLEKCTVFVFADNESGQVFWDRTGWIKRRDLLVRQALLGERSDL